MQYTVRVAAIAALAVIVATCTELLRVLRLVVF
jgi:hypothetical protein